MEKLFKDTMKIGISLNESQLHLFDIYYNELLEWNNRFNLTRITDYVEVQTKHFLDSLTIVRARQPASGDYMIDVGSGAGFPGIPLKIVFPDFKLVLLESTEKKVFFLQYITNKLELTDITIIKGRAEETARQLQYRDRFDVVLSRAVAELPVLAELTLPFCSIGGMVIALKKGNILTEVEASMKAINILGGRLKEIKKIDFFDYTDDRQLVVIEKVSMTPEKYPRRPGIPAKRPLR